MEIKKVFDNIKTLKYDKKNIFYSIPSLLTLIWGLLSILSIILIKTKYIGNIFVVSSIIIKIITGLCVFYFYYQIYIRKNNSLSLYKKYQSFTGYGIIITYVFYSFPRIVTEYYDRITNIKYITFDFIAISIITLIPTIIYLFLISDKTRLIINAYDKQTLDLEKKIKKDKILKKKEQKRLRTERNFIQNLWYDWIDIILQAILIVMLINQFLFQMYAIPSESMVPTFLKKDMVIVNKLIYGPQIPLTEWKIFSPFKPKSGDIVVFLNPKTYNKDSDVSYKNIFARIFQPFLYRLTFTKVDIDLKEDGSPKERFIVKRMIAGPDEKICILNNKVFKKKNNSDWKLMSEIQNEVEWGNCDLYLTNTPGMDNQRITEDFRRILKNTENYILSYKDKQLSNSIEFEIQSLKANLKTSNKSELSKSISKFLVENNDLFEETKRNLFVSFFTISDKNYYKYANIDIESVKKTYQYSLEDYKFAVLYKTLDMLNKNLFLQDNYLDKINTINFLITRNNKDNPYSYFMKTANALYKLNILKFTNILIEKSNNLESLLLSSNINDLFNLSIYFDGIESPNSSQFSNFSEYYSFFELSNLPEYPNNTANYINKNQYLLLGDNRYNSLDSRFGEIKKTIKIDEDDNGFLSKETTVSWDIHTIDDKFILGKAMAIYFPFNRMRFFK